MMIMGEIFEEMMKCEMRRK